MKKVYLIVIISTNGFASCARGISIYEVAKVKAKCARCIGK